MKGLNVKKIAILVIAEIITVVMSMVAHRSFLVTLVFVVLTGVGTILLSALYEWRLVVGLLISTLVSCIWVLKLLGWGWAIVLLLILLVVLWWKWQFFAKITSTTKFLLSALTILLILLMVLLFPSKTGDNNQKVATEKKTTFGEMSGETSSSEVNSEAKSGEYESNLTEEETTIQKVEGLTKDGADADAGSTTGNTNVSTKAKMSGTSGNGSNGSGGSTQDKTEDPNSEPSTNQKASEKASEIGQGTTNHEKPITGKPEGKTVVPTTEAPAEVQTTKKKFEPEEETTSVKKLEPITPTQQPTTKVVTQPTTKTVTQPTTKVMTQPTTQQPTTQQPTTQQPTTQQPTTQAHAATITVAYTEGSAVARVAVSANFTPLVTTTWKKSGATCSAKVISNDGYNVIIEVEVPSNFKDTLWVRVFDDGVERAQYVKRINNLGH